MGQSSSQSSGQFEQDNEVFLESRGYQRTKRRFKHPTAALFHVLFKSLALLFYLFGGLFGQDFKSTSVAVILLISMDFWVVKNVTGRLLVGLRWTNYIDEEGNSHWIFENKNALDKMAMHQDLETNQSNQGADSAIFWTGLILSSAMWVLLMFASIFKLNVQWFMLVALATVLSFSNLYGYIRCRLGTADMKSSITQFVAKQVFLNFLTGGSAAGKTVV